MARAVSKGARVVKSESSMPPRADGRGRERLRRGLQPLTSEEAGQQAQAERLALLVAKNKTGYSARRTV